MTRKFRPAQCLGCMFFHFGHNPRQYGGSRNQCKAGGIGGDWRLNRDDHPCDLVGSSKRPCPDFVAKTEEVK